jgi:hypothetical protein
MISDQNAPNEPSIKIDPKHPNRLIAATNLNNYYISTDTGRTWISNVQSSSFGVWGDPVIEVDTFGNFYYFHLSNPSSGNWIDRIVCQKTTDIGTTWTDGTYTGLNGTKAQDKHWSIVDRKNNNIYLTWTQFDAYASTVSTDSSNILFSRSNDGGNSWSAAKRINKIAGDCIDSDNTVEGATPAVGPNGELFAAWTGPRGIVFNRSFDTGNTWLSDPILVDPFAQDWDFDIPGISRCNGLPVLKCDLSGGPNHGTLYVNWTDQRNGTNDTEVWLSKSTNMGDSWSNPIKVNNDLSGKHQFFSWMDIDQTNGNLYFVYYDRQHYNDTRTDVTIAISLDSGNTFSNEVISDSPFTPDAGIFFGDYTNITAHGGIVRPIWTRLEAGELSIWTDLTPRMATNDTTTIDTTTSMYQIDKDIELKQYPNPSYQTTFVSFKLHEDAQINLALYNQQGEMVLALIQNETKGYGKYIIPIDLAQARLASGTYYCKLSINGEVKTLRVLYLD